MKPNSVSPEELKQAAVKKQKLDKLVAKMQLAKKGSQKLQSVLTTLKKTMSEAESL